MTVWEPARHVLLEVTLLMMERLPADNVLQELKPQTMPLSVFLVLQDPSAKKESSARSAQPVKSPPPMEPLSAIPATVDSEPIATVHFVLPALLVSTLLMMVLVNNVLRVTSPSLLEPVPANNVLLVINPTLVVLLVLLVPSTSSLLMELLVKNVSPPTSPLILVPTNVNPVL